MHTAALNKLYSALFLGAAVLAAAPAAQATIVYTNLTAAPVSITNSIDGIYLNVVTGTRGAAGTAVTGWDINIYNNNAGLTFYGNASPSGILATGTPGTQAQAVSLASGTVIGSAGQYNQFQTVGTAFQVTGQEYVGFKFLNETTATANYGWLLLSTTASAAPNSGFPAAILGYAYENNGGSILAGQIAAVPEASTFALFGLGLAGVAGMAARRRKLG